MSSSVLDTLRGVSAYPIPLRTMEAVATARGIDLSAAAVDVVATREYSLAVGDVLLWLADAPDISQGGQSYSFTDEQRLQLRARAMRIFDALDASQATGALYGYKGNRL